MCGQARPSPAVLFSSFQVVHASLYIFVFPIKYHERTTWFDVFYSNNNVLTFDLSFPLSSLTVVFISCHVDLCFVDLLEPDDDVTTNSLFSVFFLHIICLNLPDNKLNPCSMLRPCSASVPDHHTLKPLRSVDEVDHRTA